MPAGAQPGGGWPYRATHLGAAAGLQQGAEIEVCVLYFLFIFFIFFMACNAKILNKMIKVKIIPAIPISAKSQICVVSDLESFQQIYLLKYTSSFYFVYIAATAEGAGCAWDKAQSSS